MLKDLQAHIHAARFNLPIALFLGILLFILAIPKNPLLSDLDVGWLIRTGEYLLDRGQFPPGDIYSFSNPGKAWVLYQWGFEVYVGGLHRLAHLGGVVWGAALLIAITYALLLYWLLKTGLSPAWALCLGVLTALANLFHWYSRPLTATLLLYVVLLCLLESYRLKPGKQVLALPAVFLLWANIHLGFVWGLVVAAVYGVWAVAAPAALRGPGAARDPRLLAFFPFCLIAVLINPYGSELFGYLWKLGFSPNMNQHIQELKSPNFHSPCFAFILVQIALLLWLTGPSYPGRSIMLSIITVTLCLGLYSVRHITFFTIPATMHLAYSVKAGKNWPTPDRARVSREGWLLAAAAVVLSLLWVAVIDKWRPGLYAFPDKWAPIGAARYLASRAGAGQPLRIFNARDNWGSYLIYAFYPQVRVYIDTRFDMYGDEFFSEFIKMREKALRDLAAVAPLEADYILIDKQSLEARQLDRPEPGPSYRLVYEDQDALLYQGHRQEQLQSPGS